MKIYCAEFNEKFENKRLKSLREAKTFATQIYKENCEHYKQTKASFSSLNCVTQFNGKFESMAPEQQTKADRATSNNSFKEKMLEGLLKKVPNFKSILSIKADQLKIDIAQVTESTYLSRNQMRRGNASEITNQNDRISVALIWLCHGIINENFD